MREAVEHAAAPRQFCDGETVQLLVEEETGLLPVFEVHGVSHPVFDYLGHGAFRMRQTLVPALVLRQALKLAERRLVPLIDAVYAFAHGLQLAAEGAVDGVLYLVGTEGQGLCDKDAGKLVHGESGQAVRLAEDEAAAAEVVHDGAAVFERVPDAALEELRAEALVGVVR